MAFQKFLNSVESVTVNNGFMGFFHIILRIFTVIFNFFLCQMILDQEEPICEEDRKRYQTIRIVRDALDGLLYS